MKQSIYLTLLLIPLFRFPGAGQAGFRKGHIITANHVRIDGFIKNSFRTKGELLILQDHGYKKTYTALEIKSFKIDSTSYISFCNDFYEEIVVGKKASLYQKITNNGDAKIYNGSEVVGYIKASPGRSGDFYISLSPGISLELITQKNFKGYFTSLFNKNNQASSISDETLQYSNIRTVVELFNK